MKTRDMPQVNIRIKPELKKWLAGEAERRDRSQNWLISKLLEDAMLGSRTQIK